jgi:DNA repair exonuclease SbcCD ATPase subunit
MSINPIEPNNIKPVTDTKSVPETKNITNIQSQNISTSVSNPTDQITTNQNISSEVSNNNPQANAEVIQEPPLEVKLQQTLTDNNLPLEEKIKLIDKLIDQKKQEIQNIDNEINNLKSNQTNRLNDPIGQNILNISNQNKILALESQKSAINNQISMLEATKNNLVNLNNESRNLTSQLESINSVYDTSLNHLRMLKEQLERYHQSMADNYNKQIETLYNQINQLEKEIQDLLNTHPSNPDEANQIAQQIAQKRSLQDVLRNQLESTKQQLFTLNQNVQQQIKDLDDQIANTLKEKQLNYYQKWALDQSIRREIENIVWGEMLNEKNHVLSMWKMYYDYTQKVRQMWQDIYTKQLANESSFIAAWSKALGA